jgi:hypothetical protein
MICNAGDEGSPSNENSNNISLLADVWTPYPKKKIINKKKSDVWTDHLGCGCAILCFLYFLFFWL